MVHPHRQTVSDWLRCIPKVDGIYRASADRRFAHDETSYDEQYQSPDLDITRADFITDLLAPTFAVNPPAHILEIASGPGTLTLGLRNRFPRAHIFATDASSMFLNIMKRKVDQLGFSSEESLSLIQLSDTEFHLLPRVFDLICIRSGLHHFVDWPQVLSTLSTCLNANGLICMLEPRADFFIVSSILLQLMLERLEKISPAQSAQAAEHVKLFQETSKFYIRNDISKEGAEDKYAFFLEDLQREATKNNLNIAALGAEFACGFSLEFLNYLKYCMSFPASLVKSASEILDEELTMLEQCYGSRATFYGAAEWYALSSMPVRTSR